MGVWKRAAAAFPGGSKKEDRHLFRSESQFKSEGLWSGKDVSPLFSEPSFRNWAAGLLTFYDICTIIEI